MITIKMMLQNKENFIYCLAWSFLLLFFVSPDSYTHDLFFRWDSAVFFSSGKAWMEGLRPYVDFADSKGPVLWFIYGIGYLISNYDYIGVFWLSVLSYAVVFYFDFLIALFFLKDKKLAWLVVLLLPLVYFNPWYHFEVRAEDWCFPVLKATLYSICLMLYGNERDKRKNANVAAFMIGLCIMWTFLIKYSITVMVTISFGGILLHYLIREKISCVSPSFYFILGCFILGAPFYFYMLYTDIFDSFVKEYLLNTMATVQSANSAGKYLREWLGTLNDAYYAVLFFIGMLGSLVIVSRMDKYRYALVFTFVVFYGISIHHAIHLYYLSINLFLLVFAVIFLVGKMQSFFLQHIRRVSLVGSLSVFLLVVITNFTFTEGFFVPCLFFKDGQRRKDYYEIAYYLAQLPKPTIVYYNLTDRGYGVPAGALPGSVYWTSQTGATPDMIRVQYEDVVSMKSDFVLAHHTAQNDSLFAKLGYIRQCNTAGLTLYSKHSLTPMPSSFSVSNMDVLFKRRIFPL